MVHAVSMAALPQKVKPKQPGYTRRTCRFARPFKGNKKAAGENQPLRDQQEVKTYFKMRRKEAMPSKLNPSNTTEAPPSGTDVGEITEV